MRTELYQSNGRFDFVTKCPNKTSAFASTELTPFNKRLESSQIVRYLNIAGYALSMLIVLWMYSVHVRSILQYPYFAPSANVEEIAYTNISATNFNNYGFLATDFLQDFAASPNRADHPFVYDHMPPGPDIARALVMRATGGSFRWTAIFFASLVPLGFAFFFLFVNRVLRHRAILDGVFVFLLIPWAQYVGHFSNPIWNAVLLLTFAPLVILQWSYQYKNMNLFNFVGLPLILVSSIYLDYIVLSSIIACWIALYFLQVARLGRRELILAIAAIAFGIFLNLAKNLVYFGPTLFAHELFYVLANRVTGWPSQQTLASFYAEHGILHHGARPPHVSILWNVIRANFYFEGIKYFFAAAVASLFLTIDVRISAQKHFVRILPTFATVSDFKLILKTALYISAILLTPIFLFPAFAQEVNLSGGTNHIWLGLLSVTLVSVACTRLIEMVFPTAIIWWRTRSLIFRIPSTCQAAAQAIVYLTVFIFVSALLTVRIENPISRTKGIIAGIQSAYAQNPNVELEHLRKFSSAPFMTNINVPTIYFYTGAVGFGVCGLDSVAENGHLDLEDCKIALVRNRALHANVRPSYFFFVKAPPYFPGFADCGPNTFISPEEQALRAPAGCFEIQKSRLDKNFAKVLDTRLYNVYDLNKSPPN